MQTPVALHRRNKIEQSEVALAIREHGITRLQVSWLGSWLIDGLIGWWWIFGANIG